MTPNLSPNQNKNFHEDEDEHLNILEDAHAALRAAEENLRIGRERLQNAIDKYEERKKNGPTRTI